MLIATNQCHNEEATAEARRHKREFAALSFLCGSHPLTLSRLADNLLTCRLPVLHLRLYRVQPLPHPPLSCLPRTLLTRQQWLHNPLPLCTLRPLAFNILPPIGPCSDPKRPRIPSQGNAPLGSHPGYRPPFPDNTRPVGSTAPSSTRSSRGPLRQRERRHYRYGLYCSGQRC